MDCIWESTFILKLGLHRIIDKNRIKIKGNYHWSTEFIKVTYKLLEKSKNER